MMNTFFCKSKKFLLTLVPKVASSSLKMWLHKIEDVSCIKNNGDCDKCNTNIHGCKCINKIANLDEVIESNYDLYSFVRNPYSRILSAFQNKIIDDNFWKLEKLGRKPSVIYYKFGTFLKERSNDTENDIYFHLKKIKSNKHYFLLFLQMLDSDPEIMKEEHIATQTSILRLDILKYKFIGKLETMERDFQVFLSKIDECTPLNFRKEVSGLPNSFNSETKLKSFYSAEHLNIVNKIYDDDFKNFSYTKKTDLFESGYSLVTCSMNRTKYLLESIQTWNEIEELNEIIVVDYSSDKPILESDLPKPKFGKKIILVRVSNEKRWVLSHAYNLGISFAQYDKLLKIDSDIKLSKDFISSHPLKENVFYRGHWANARNENEIHFNGQLICNTSDFFAVNGYNERITTYGYDDTDLYIRIEQTTKSKLKDFDYDKMNHIESNSEVRVENQNINVKKRFAISDLFENQQIEQDIIDELIWVPFPDNGEDLRLFLETQINRIRCEKNPWSVNNNLIKWKVDALSDTIYNCERR